MPDNPLPLPIARPHNNRQLFSGYYLDVLLPRRPHWALLLEEAERLRGAIVGVYGKFTALLEGEPECASTFPLLSPRGVRRPADGRGRHPARKPRIHAERGRFAYEPGLYRDVYSLFAIKREVAWDLSMGRNLLPVSAHLWPNHLPYSFSCHRSPVPGCIRCKSRS